MISTSDGRENSGPGQPLGAVYHYVTIAATALVLIIFDFGKDWLAQMFVLLKVDAVASLLALIIFSSSRQAQGQPKATPFRILATMPFIFVLGGLYAEHLRPADQPIDLQGAILIAAVAAYSLAARLIQAGKLPADRADHDFTRPTFSDFLVLGSGGLLSPTVIMGDNAVVPTCYLMMAAMRLVWMMIP